VIGAGGAIPWRLPDDLKRLRALTTGHTVIMGRKTYESIGRPLPNRENVVVTRQAGYQAPGCTVVGSVEDALRAAGHEDTVFILGGGEIYAATIGLAGRLFLTHVDAEVQGGDAWFPEVDPAQWRLVAREEHPADARHEYRFEYVDYVRTSPPAPLRTGEGRFSGH
jgi:dihydrofolate reductase